MATVKKEEKAKKSDKKEETKVTKTETKKEEKKETKCETISGLSFEGEVVLVYIITIVGFIFALMKDKNVDKKLRFHYNQAATAFIVSICFNVLTVIAPLLAPVIGLCAIALFVFVIITLVQTLSNKVDYYRIPLISDLSEKIFGKIEE